MLPLPSPAQNASSCAAAQIAAEHSNASIIQRKGIIEQNAQVKLKQEDHCSYRYPDKQPPGRTAADGNYPAKKAAENTGYDNNLIPLSRLQKSPRNPYGSQEKEQQAKKDRTNAAQQDGFSVS